MPIVGTTTQASKATKMSAFAAWIDQNIHTKTDKIITIFYPFIKIYPINIGIAMYLRMRKYKKIFSSCI